MKIIGIDYGRRRIGLAIATSKIAEPLKVTRVGSQKDAVGKVVKVISSFAKAPASQRGELKDKKVEKVEMVVVGISEGMMAEETKEFAKNLEEALNLPVVFQDETLSTQEAQRLALEAKVKRKKRREFEDAYTAAIILQNYLNERF
jgi:putative Holliday junction resolvase